MSFGVFLYCLPSSACVLVEPPLGRARRSLSTLAVTQFLRGFAGPPREDERIDISTHLLKKLKQCIKDEERQRGSLPLAQLVDSVCRLIERDSRRSQLLQAFQSQVNNQQIAAMGKFASIPSIAGADRGSDNDVLIGGQYRVLGMASASAPRISSGKSVVMDAVRQKDGRGRLKVKLSRNLVALSREAENLRRLRRDNAAAKATIQMYDFLENYDSRGSHALVMEAGEQNLEEFVKKRGRLSAGEVKRLTRPVLNVLAALERERLVWTDLRPSNLVMVKGQVKAIDLESAMEVDNKPVDCSTENIPPEIARLYVNGKLTQAVVVPAYDVWSLGILVLSLASGGKHLFDDEMPGKWMTLLATLTQEEVRRRVSRLVSDRGMANAIQKILVVDPARRPSIGRLKTDFFWLLPF